MISDIEEEDKNAFQVLQAQNAIEESEGLWKLHSRYRAGRLYISNDGKGYVEAEFKEQRDLLVEVDHLEDAKHGDVVVVKRIIAKRGRASGKVITVISKAHLFTIAYTHRDVQGNFSILNIRTAEPIHAMMDGMDLKAFTLGTVLKVDVENDKVLEILGNLNDAKVDEKISLALYKREDIFPQECISDALKIEQEVNKEDYPKRIDLTDLNFCTIDPITAKDFDDAIYFDLEKYELYVAIADVSHYVPYFTPIDKEAKKRGFTTYFPHKSFPMLPRELSESICSLKPKVNRLAFVAKITLDRSTLKATKEVFFEAIIHSKHRFNYEDVDKIIHNKNQEEQKHIESVQKILKYLLPLYDITKNLRKARLRHGFDFRSEETKVSIDAKHLLKDTTIETGTASHSLIEECMLLANQASAKRFGDDEESIFRIHEPPQLSRIEQVLTELSSIGLYVTEYEDSPSLIRAIQKEAHKMGLASEVDTMIIKSLRQASYMVKNVGHFGLGFSHYSHFTSPIRRYSDLILHRLIKTHLVNEEEEASYLLRNIEPLCARVSELEREATKAEWDFRDRKFARWAEEHIDEIFEAEIIEAGEASKAVLIGDIKGISVNIHGDNVMLFDRIRLRIVEVNIAQAIIMAEFVEKLDKDEMEL
ncbi:3'-to-5' exoribonuclease RNase R [hydrothermal vent metagenome]|uniref:exoribonuclease II n=1 Tax=hydrothermal vent metagenome TaxID=652676 RepID=A0A1W1CZY9_9ZZZZ